MSVPACLLVKEVVNVVYTEDQRYSRNIIYTFYGYPTSKGANKVGLFTPLFYAVALLETGDMVYFRWKSEEEELAEYYLDQGCVLLGKGIYHHCEKA